MMEVLHSIVTSTGASLEHVQSSLRQLIIPIHASHNTCSATSSGLEYEFFSYSQNEGIVFDPLIYFIRYFYVYYF